MESMFNNAYKFNRDLSSWDVSSVSTVFEMFYAAEAFRQNLCSWGSKVHRNTNVANMFTGSNCPYNATYPDLINNYPYGPFCYACS